MKLYTILKTILSPINENTFKLQPSIVPDEYKGMYIKIVKLINSKGDEGISKEELMSASGLNDKLISNILSYLEDNNIISSDTESIPQTVDNLDEPEDENEDEVEDTYYKNDEEEPEEIEPDNIKDENTDDVELLATLQKQKNELLASYKDGEITLDQYKAAIGDIPQQIKVLKAKLDPTLDEEYVEELTESYRNRMKKLAGIIK